MKTNKKTIMLEPYMKKHAELFAISECDQLGLSPEDHGYDDAFKNAFLRFCDEAVVESIIPYRTNPRKQAVPKSQTNIFYSTDPDGSFYKMFENLDSKERSELANNLRKGIDRIWETLYLSMYSHKSKGSSSESDPIFSGEPKKDFTFKDGKGNPKNVDILRNRYARTAIYAIIVAHLDNLFQHLPSEDDLEKSLVDIMKNLKITNDNFDAIKISGKKKVGSAISKAFHETESIKLGNKGQQKLF